MSNPRVIISGAGPSGLTMSALLARMRVKHLVVEKASSISTHPMAHYVNVRTMEILRSEFGSLEEEVRRLSPPRSAWKDFVWCTSVSGRTLFRMTHESFNVKSFCESTHLSQNKITPNLLQDILSHDNSSHSDVKFDCAVESFEEKNGKVFVKLSNGEELVCDYLVGADGANSKIRSQLGIDMTGKSELQTLMNIHFKCTPGLNWSNNQAAMLFFVYNPECTAVFVAHDLETGEWVCQVPFFPPFQTPENSFSLEQCKKIVVAGLGVADQDVKILSAAPWTMDAKVARKYSSDGKRVILIGDAVHRFPPAGGFGMNTGIQDAHNLAWKIGAVVHGSHNGSLLDSYEAERRPVAIANTILSLKNYDKVLQMAKAVGLDDKHLENMIFKKMSMTMGRTAIKMAQSQLGCLGIRGHPLGELRIANLERLLRDGGGLPLFYPKHELEFGYTKQDLVKESPSETPVVGYRVPHCRVAISHDKHTSVCSFLEFSALVKGTPCFVLIVVEGETVNRNFFDQPFIKVEVSPQDPDQSPLSNDFEKPDALKSQSWVSDYISQCLLVGNIDSDGDPSSSNMVLNLKCCDFYGDWELSTRQKAVLLRPDGHVLWVQQNDEKFPEKLSLVLNEDNLLAVSAQRPTA